MPLNKEFLFLHLFLLASFFRHRFFQLFYRATQIDRDDLDGVSSFALNSDSLIWLRYSVRSHLDFFFNFFKPLISAFDVIVQPLIHMCAHFFIALFSNFRPLLRAYVVLHAQNILKSENILAHFRVLGNNFNNVNVQFTLIFWKWNS